MQHLKGVEFSFFIFEFYFCCLHYGIRSLPHLEHLTSYISRNTFPLVSVSMHSLLPSLQIWQNSCVIVCLYNFQSFSDISKSCANLVQITFVRYYCNVIFKNTSKPASCTTRTTSTNGKSVAP